MFLQLKKVMIQSNHQSSSTYYNPPLQTYHNTLMKDPFESPQESLEPGLETRARLLALATEKPAQDPEVRALLLQWIEETTVPESLDAPSVEYVEVEIIHTAMKYRLGFITQEECLADLEQAGGLLASEHIDTIGLHKRLSQLIYAIEDGTFDKIK